ncbi:hypothetical protein SDC9_74872 [bioreactor metagenome]|uniref:HU domain-containing protein n=1 Tax=bioreactor metagenome TaxID=1076179 RepID=A0A644YIZ8_9ZZZZ
MIIRVNRIKIMNYTIVERKIPVGTGAGMKHLAVISRNGAMSEEQLIERIAGMSSLAENDVLSALRALQVVIADATMNGITVRLDQLGTFTPYLSAKAMETPEEVDASTIRGIKVNFRPNVRFKNKLKTTSMEYRNPAPKGLVADNPETPVAP